MRTTLILTLALLLTAGSVKHGRCAPTLMQDEVSGGLVWVYPPGERPLSYRIQDAASCAYIDCCYYAENIARARAEAVQRHYFGE